MAAIIERPSFYEGQILAGADLNAAVDHARGQLARHERHLHLWGIAEGLELRGEDRKTANGTPYKDITVTAGAALDGSGRELVLAADTRLPPEALDKTNVSAAQMPGDIVWYPVFLKGGDKAPPAPALSLARCGSPEPNRLREETEFHFGRPGDASATEDPAGVAAGPDTGPTTPRRVLLGFVRWDPDIARFSGVATTQDGVGPRYAGVRADTVAARGGTLALRTRKEVEKGKPGLTLSEDGNGLLAWGPLKADGSVAPVLSVNAKGDLTITGKFSGAVTPGTVQAQSGVFSDGMLLPLPPGITPEMLDEGQATAHVHLTMHAPPGAAPTGDPDWIVVPHECFLDANRRLRCTARWLRTAGTPVDLPGLCDYMVLVSVAAS